MAVKNKAQFFGDIDVSSVVTQEQDSGSSLSMEDWVVSKDSKQPLIYHDTSEMDSHLSSSRIEKKQVKIREEIEHTLLTKAIRTDDQLLSLISRQILARREKDLFSKFLVHEDRRGSLASRQSNLRTMIIERNLKDPGVRERLIDKTLFGFIMHEKEAPAPSNIPMERKSLKEIVRRAHNYASRAEESRRREILFSHNVLPEVIGPQHIRLQMSEYMENQMPKNIIRDQKNLYHRQLIREAIVKNSKMNKLNQQMRQNIDIINFLMEHQEKETNEMDDLFLKRAADRATSSKRVIVKDERHYDDQDLDFSLNSVKVAKLFMKLATLHEPAGRVIRRSQWEYFIDEITAPDMLLRKVRPYLKEEFFGKLKNDKEEIELQDFRHALVRMPQEQKVRIMLRRFTKENRIPMFLKSYIIPYYSKEVQDEGDQIYNHPKLEQWLSMRRKHFKAIYEHVTSFPISESEEIIVEDGVTLRQYLEFLKLCGIFPNLMVKNQVFYVFFAYANVSDCLTFGPFCLSLVYLAIRWFKKHSNAWYYNKRHIITELDSFYFKKGIFMKCQIVKKLKTEAEKRRLSQMRHSFFTGRHYSVNLQPNIYKF